MATIAFHVEAVRGHVHDLLNDLGKEAVMADIKVWIEARLPRA
jgi:hypothetical protein